MSSKFALTAVAPTVLLLAMIATPPAAAAPLSLSFTTLSVGINNEALWDTTPVSGQFTNWAAQPGGNTWQVLEKYNPVNGQPRNEGNLNVSIVGYKVLAADTGTFSIMASDGTTISDQIVESNANGSGLIIFKTQGFVSLGTVIGQEDPTNGFAGQLVIHLAGTGGTNLTLTAFSNGDPIAAGMVSDSLTISVPEPATLSVIGIGVAGLGYARRRRG